MDLPQHTPGIQIRCPINNSHVRTVNNPHAVQLCTPTVSHFPIVRVYTFPSGSLPLLVLLFIILLSTEKEEVLGHNMELEIER